ncbi:unnamed protein product [Gongylonema pulchrum]|uniref:Uncharacterized protein n=1 Tax=Gongylonema pulchrum TaxID=637853 RepID=A0A183ECY9_9BILA|nr:unnamed protein product [Gongylonema pulchrum]
METESGEAASALPEFVRQMNVEQRRVVKEHFLLMVMACRYSGCYLPAHRKDDFNTVLYVLRILFIVIISALCKFLHIINREPA